MSRDKQIDVIYEDLVEIFDEEYNRRNLITPQNTAERMTDKGYRKSTELAEEIFAEIEKAFTVKYPMCTNPVLVLDSLTFAELKKKYTEELKNEK